MPTITMGKITIAAVAGQDLLSQLLDAGAPIGYLCMAGACGTCKVRVIAGAEHLEAVTPIERHHSGMRDGSHRLACQAVCLASGDVVIAQP